MSAGAFQYSKYESDQGGIYRIRVQPETLAATVDATVNGAPTGAIDSQGTVRVSNPRRGFGITPRRISIRWVGAPPTGYKADETVQVVILTPALYNAANIGDPVTYLATNATVTGKSAEVVR